MKKLKSHFEKYLGFKITKPLENSGRINATSYNVNYIVKLDEFKYYYIDFLLFDCDFMPPLHLRINYKGEIEDLENFQISIMYIAGDDEMRFIEQEKMRFKNRRVAQQLLNKGLASQDDNWLSMYL